MIVIKVIFCREYLNICIIIFIGLIIRVDLKKILRGGEVGGLKDNSVQIFYDFIYFFLNLCMDYIVIKNVKREKGGIIFLDSVQNDRKYKFNLSVLNESQ